DERHAKCAVRHHPSSPLRRVTRSPLREYRLPHAGQFSSTTPSGSFTPHSQTQPVIRAGTPVTCAYGGTSFVTTPPAPTKAYGPSVVPQTTVAFAPIVVPFRTSVDWNSSRRGT